MIDVEELQDRLLNAERTLRDGAKTCPPGVDQERLKSKAEGIALARSYVETMARW